MRHAIRTTLLVPCLLLIVALSASPRAAVAGPQQLDPIRIEVSRFEGATYALPRQTPPAVDIDTLPRPVRKPYENYRKAADGADKDEARADLLEALRKQEKKLEGEHWLLRGALLEDQAQADYDAAMGAYADSAGEGEPPVVDLDPAVAAYESAAAEGSAEIGAWAHYAIGVALATEDAGRAIQALMKVADSDAVADLRGEAMVRIAELETNPGKAEEALRNAAEMDKGKVRGRAALGLAHAALERDEYGEAIARAGQTLDGPAFDGDRDQALGIAVRALASAGGDAAGQLPDDLSPERKADVLIELGEFWMSDPWGVHPAEAVAAFEQALEVAPGAAKVRGVEKKRDQARELASAEDETEAAYLSRIAHYCFGMALVGAPTFEADIDLHLTPGKKGAPPTVAAEVFTVKETDSNTELQGCLSGEGLPAPMNPKLKETKVTIKLTAN